MKKLLLGLLVVLSILLVACNNDQPSVEDATATFCQNLQELGATLDNLGAINATSTVGDLQNAASGVEAAWKATTKSAQELHDVKMDDIDEAWKNLQQTIDDVDSNDTLAAAMANITVGLGEVRLAFDQIGQVACPGMDKLGPAPQESSEAPTPAPEAVATEPAPVGFTGAYSATIPLTGDLETQMVLVLNEDLSAFLVTRTSGQANEITVSGQWVDNGDETATVTLSDLMNGDQLAIPEVLSFRLDNGDLTAVEFDETVYGPQGFTMARMEGAAIAAEVEAVAPPQASEPLTASEQVTTSIAMTPSESITATAPVTTVEATPATPLLPDLSTVTPPAQAAVEGTDAGSPIVGTWQLQQITQSGGIVYVPDDPSLYGLTFTPVGTLSVLADCNTGAGTYQASPSGSLMLQITATRAYCGTGSLSSQFISYLMVANSYEVTGDALSIGFSNNSGTMNFLAVP